MIILNKNPLNDIRNTKDIHAMAFNGNLYDRKTLADISRQVQQRANSWAIGCKIIGNLLKIRRDIESVGWLALKRESEKRDARPRKSRALGGVYSSVTSTSTAKPMDS